MAGPSTLMTPPPLNSTAACCCCCRRSAACCGSGAAKGCSTPRLLVAEQAAAPGVEVAAVIAATLGATLQRVGMLKAGVGVRNGKGAFIRPASHLHIRIQWESRAGAETGGRSPGSSAQRVPLLATDGQLEGAKSLPAISCASAQAYPSA